MKEPRKILKHGQERWQADLREIGGGRPVFKSKADAKRYQSDAYRAHAEHGVVGVKMPLETMRHYLALEGRMEKLGGTLEQAVDWWEDTHRDIERKPIGEAVKECIQAKRVAGLRFRSLEQLGYSLESLETAVGSKTACSSVTHKQVEDWLGNPKWSTRTRRGHLTNARTFFSFCLKRNWVASDPTAAIERFRLDAIAPGILTVPQVKLLFSECQKSEPRLLPYLTLGIFCGVRPWELRALTWSEISLDRGYVEIPARVAKTRRDRRLIKLQPNAIDWLKLGGDLPPTNWRRRFIRVRTAAGFAVEDSKEGTKWPHDAMRHTFCSYAIPAFGASKTTEWAGHSEAMLFQHYRELVTEEAAKEFWAITPGKLKSGD